MDFDLRALYREMLQGGLEERRGYFSAVFRSEQFQYLGEERDPSLPVDDIHLGLWDAQIFEIFKEMCSPQYQTSIQVINKNSHRGAGGLSGVWRGCGKIRKE